MTKIYNEKCYQALQPIIENYGLGIVLGTIATIITMRESTKAVSPSPTVSDRYNPLDANPPF